MPLHKTNFICPSCGIYLYEIMDALVCKECKYINLNLIASSEYFKSRQRERDKSLFCNTRGVESKNSIDKRRRRIKYHTSNKGKLKGDRFPIDTRPAEERYPILGSLVKKRRKERVE